MAASLAAPGGIEKVESDLSATAGKLRMLQCLSKDDDRLVHKIEPDCPLLSSQP
jgi:hypothetical protein